MSSTEQSKCVASCKATASGKCEASCTGHEGMADCTANCQAVCEGKCTAEANLTCEYDCENQSWAQCETDMQGGCTAQCTQPDGALFCDGQYVDAGNNLADCVASLEAALNITVTGYAHGSCSGNQCSGEAGGEASCAVPKGHSGAGATLGAGLVVGALAWMRRRKRSK
jgi:hypothetical protein